MVCPLRAGDFGHWMLTFSHIGERSCKYDIKFLLTYNIRRNPFFNYEKHKLQKKNTLYTYSYNPIIHSWLEYGKHFQKKMILEGLRLSYKNYIYCIIFPFFSPLCNVMYVYLFWSDLKNLEYTCNKMIVIFIINMYRYNKYVWFISPFKICS